MVDMLSPKLPERHPLTSTPIRRLSGSVLGVTSSPLSPLLSQPYKIHRSVSLTQSQGYVSLSPSSPTVKSDSPMNEKAFSARTLGGRLEFAEIQKAPDICEEYNIKTCRSNVLPGWICKLSQDLKQQQSANKTLALCLYFTQLVTLHYKRQQANLQNKLDMCQQQILQLQQQTRQQVLTIEKIEASKDQLRRHHRQLALHNKTRLIRQKHREEEIKDIVKECQQLMERQQKVLQNHHFKLQEFEKEGNIVLDSGLFFFALYISKSRIIQESINVLITRLAQSPQHRKWVNLVLQWMYVVEIMVMLRWMARSAKFYKGFNGVVNSLRSMPKQAWKYFTAWITKPD